MTTKTTAPVLNLNGTSGESLMREYSAAADALRTAIEAVASITVHGRDFQTVCRGQYLTARAEQEARLDALQGVLKEIESLQMQVHDQMLARTRR